MRHRLIWIALVFSLLIGCKDKAKDPYAKCLQLDAASDIKGAWEACNAAVAADPTSTSGKAATAKLTELKPKYDAWKQADEAKQAKEAEARRKANEEAARAAREAEAQRVATLRQKVTRKYDGTEPDTECTGKGLPPYRWDYGGGTFAENQEVASADGCRKLHQTVEIQVYCCPKKPNSGSLW